MKNNLSLKINLLTFLMSFCLAQKDVKKDSLVYEKWFVSYSMGAQISGIKTEAFVSSNVSPAVTFCLGKWVSPEIALQVGFKGLYFHTISNDDKRYYNFIYGNVLFDVNKMGGMKNINRKWNFIFYPGGGYFYNYYYNRPNICANIGFMSSGTFEGYNIFLDISAIMAWDIYQGNEDILPSANIGLIYEI